MWAITSYFNPSGYRSKYRNYQVFRRALDLPLVAVELVYGGEPELTERDAEVLIRLRGRDVLWQKERLLNVALEAVPASAGAVAWLDCDVLLERPDWAAAATEALRHHVLVQPFSELYEAPARLAASAACPEPSSWKLCGTGIAKRLRDEPGAASIFELGAATRSSGLAWVGRREVLDEVGFYDACILGGGDRALLAAAVGEIDGPARHWHWNSRQASHYRAWAERFHAAVGGRVGVVDGPIVHLWHGDAEHRRYRQRLVDLASLGFDPDRDIALGSGGCWQWNAPEEALRTYVARYFDERREDG